MTGRDEQFHDFALARRPGMVHTATMLTAGDRHLAEDVVQKTLASLYINWSKFQRAANPTPFGAQAGIEYLFVAVVGGAGYVWGGVLGAAIVIILKEVLQSYLPLLLHGSGQLETRAAPGHASAAAETSPSPLHASTAGGELSATAAGALASRRVARRSESPAIDSSSSVATVQGSGVVRTGWPGQEASRSRRCRSRHARHGPPEGGTSGPITAAPSRTVTARWGWRRCA